MKIGAIAEQVQKVEGFKIQIFDTDIMRPFRADKVIDLDYKYKRAAPSKMTVSQWSYQRMPGVLVRVYNSDDEEVHGRTVLSTVRQSYAI